MERTLLEVFINFGQKNIIRGRILKGIILDIRGFTLQTKKKIFMIKR